MYFIIFVKKGKERKIKSKCFWCGTREQLILLSLQHSKQIRHSINSLSSLISLLDATTANPLPIVIRSAISEGLIRGKRDHEGQGAHPHTDDENGNYFPIRVIRIVDHVVEPGKVVHEGHGPGADGQRAREVDEGELGEEAEVRYVGDHADEDLQEGDVSLENEHQKMDYQNTVD